MRSIEATVALVAGVIMAGGALAATPEELLAAGKCNKCHTAKTTKKGPSFASVAEKYKGQADAPAKIVQMLKTGGTDDHDKVAAGDAELKALAAFVLSQK